jgi:hypothetical protein
MTQQNDETTKSKTVRVRPVDGRLYRHDVTREAVTDEVELPRTRSIERAILAGDLEEVGAPEPAAQPEAQVQPEPALEKERY